MGSSAAVVEFWEEWESRRSKSLMTGFSLGIIEVIAGFWSCFLDWVGFGDGFFIILVCLGDSCSSDG